MSYVSAMLLQIIYTYTILAARLGHCLGKC